MKGKDSRNLAEKAEMSAASSETLSEDNAT
jgi:hypothetical protein